MREIRVPYGVNVLWDPIASIELAVATGATFVREIFTGLYASDFGLWNTNCGEAARQRRRLGGENVRLFFNIVPEAAVYLGNRDIAVDCALDRIQHAARCAVRFGADCRRRDIAGTCSRSRRPCRIRRSLPTPACVSTTWRRSWRLSDGAVVGTTFKRDGYIWNDVDVAASRNLWPSVRGCGRAC